jgi:hypothetical protein
MTMIKGSCSCEINGRLGGKLILSVRVGSMKQLLGAALLITGSCAMGSPCDKVAFSLTSTQRTSFSTAVAAQLQSESVKILHSYRLANWYLFYVSTHVADEDFVFYRGDPPNHQYTALWSGTAAGTEQAELRNWARMNAPGIPESLAKCFASSAATVHKR